MLIFPVLRLVMLVLLLAVLVDGATERDFYNNWSFLLWDESPDLPSGFFDLLRIAVSVCLAWDMWTHTRYARLGYVGSNGWAIVLALLLILYQPIFPVGLSYQWWLWVDLFALCLLAVHTSILLAPLIRLLKKSAASRGENPLSVPLHAVSAAVFLGYTNVGSLMGRANMPLPEETSGPPDEAVKNAPAQSKVKSRGLTPLEDQISRVQKMQDRLQSAMDNPDLSPAKREAAERAARLAQHLIDQRKTRTTNTKPTYPSENLSPHRRKLWDIAQEALVDPSKTPQQKQAAQHVQDVIAAPYRKQRLRDRDDL